MQKNVAGQFLTVYVWDSTTGLPKTGDAANLTAYRAIDGGSVTVLGDTSATEKDSTNAKGYYQFDLTQAETNGGVILFTCKSSTANMVCRCEPDVIQTVPANFSDMDATEIANATLTSALTESYAADGAAPTLAQFQFMLWSFWSEASISGVTKTSKNLAGSAAMTFTLDSATQPTSITRAT